MLMFLRKRRTDNDSSDQYLEWKKKTVIANQKPTFEPELTIFDKLNSDCMDEMLDWLDLDSLCALSRTCKSLQKFTKNYFQWKYISQEFTVGDEFVYNPKYVNCFGDDVQILRFFDSSLDDFKFAGSNINLCLREIEFNQTYKLENLITKKHIDHMKDVLENVKVLRAVDCDFSKGCAKYLLDCSKNVENFAFKIHKNVQKYKIEFQRYPSMKNIEIHFDSKVKVTEVMNMLKEQIGHVFLDELVLLFCKEHDPSMVFTELNMMYNKQFYKHLYLMFKKKSMVSEHIDQIASVKGLKGLTFLYTINISTDIHLTDITKLQNIKYLYLNSLLCRVDQIAQSLHQLEEMEISVTSITAIISFVRYSANLTKLHIVQVRANNEQFNWSILEKQRIMLKNAKKLVIYMPEKKFLELKWSSPKVSSVLVEFKREESYRPKNLTYHINSVN
ncbi:uncharacterized protein LOC116338965 [Contarinia nasturtii]|uniref:uncharacterized protein LOC116338965 n=1 Tax=Contarinia nasturtii TaxID=265458 RepID=UPI0012D3E50B|nr:uncharacterized protein LOC116338965 [Contarinia nasturtii]